MNKPDKTVKIGVVLVCDAGVSGGLGLGSFWPDATQRKMEANERASKQCGCSRPRKKMRLLNSLCTFTFKENKISSSLIFSFFFQ